MVGAETAFGVALAAMLGTLGVGLTSFLRRVRILSCSKCCDVELDQETHPPVAPSLPASVHPSSHQPSPSPLRRELRAYSDPAPSVGNLSGVEV